MSGKSVGKSSKTYSQKRDFTRTPEPSDHEGAPHKHASAEGGIFVVHKHAASHLHWDLRLENKGVLESWAVPKEPPVEPLASLSVRSFIEEIAARSSAPGGGSTSAACAP